MFYPPVPVRKRFHPNRKAEFGGDSGKEILFEENTYYEADDTAFHELTHLLFARQCSSLGQVMDEGLADYAEYEVSKKYNFPAWNTIQYINYQNYRSPYDDSAIYADPEAEFIASTIEERNGGQRNYQYVGTHSALNTWNI